MHKFRYIIRQYTAGSSICMVCANGVGHTRIVHYLQPSPRWRLWNDSGAYPCPSTLNIRILFGISVNIVWVRLPDIMVSDVFWCSIIKKETWEKSSRDIRSYLKIVEQKCLLVKAALLGIAAKILKLSLQIGKSDGYWRKHMLIIKDQD